MKHSSIIHIKYRAETSNSSHTWSHEESMSEPMYSPNPRSWRDQIHFSWEILTVICFLVLFNFIISLPKLPAYLLVCFPHLRREVRFGKSACHSFSLEEKCMSILCWALPVHLPHPCCNFTPSPLSHFIFFLCFGTSESMVSN
jgi:hypothetical protein